jgi:hypothetical protein
MTTLEDDLENVTLSIIEVRKAIEELNRKGITMSRKDRMVINRKIIWLEKQNNKIIALQKKARQS